MPAGKHQERKLFAQPRVMQTIHKYCKIKLYEHKQRNKTFQILKEILSTVLEDVSMQR
jgi:hypothetical protein